MPGWICLRTSPNSDADRGGLLWLARGGSRACAFPGAKRTRVQEVRSTGNLLARMEPARQARRADDGTITSSRWSLPGIMIFGPNRRLAQGRYRLTVAFDARRVRRKDLPVMGIEVIAQARFQ